jgi:hypothetical protein
LTEPLEIDVRLSPIDASLQRLLVVLHKRRAIVDRVVFESRVTYHFAEVALRIPSDSSSRILAAIRREVVVIDVVERGARGAA